MSKKQERRLLGVRFTPEFLSIFFKKGKIVIANTLIPTDAEYQSTHYDYETDTFITYFYHPSFDLTVDGQCIPLVAPDAIEYRRTK